ncbi:MAG TPA: DUF4440 domain-containing protein [Xanthomonadales bacterium]|nr:DUF4440 domain-containing protein [Xanthomonadales bacterium]
MIRFAALILLFISTLAIAAGEVAPPPQHHARPGPQTTPELKATVLELDAKLFGAVFDRCDTEQLRGLVAEDFEFYHDKDGLSVTSGTQMVDNLRGMCARQKTGEDYRARRELDAATSEVFAMNNYGAIHTGVHRFYMLEPGKPEKLVEISRFSNLWHRDDQGKWMLTRVFSYDHRTTE